MVQGWSSSAFSASNKLKCWPPEMGFFIFSDIKTYLIIFVRLCIREPSKRRLWYQKVFLSSNSEFRSSSNLKRDLLSYHFRHRCMMAPSKPRLWYQKVFLSFNSEFRSSSNIKRDLLSHYFRSCVWEHLLNPIPDIKRLFLSFNLKHFISPCNHRHWPWCQSSNFTVKFRILAVIKQISALFRARCYWPEKACFFGERLTG